MIKLWVCSDCDAEFGKLAQAKKHTCKEMKSASTPEYDEPIYKGA